MSQKQTYKNRPLLSERFGRYLLNLPLTKNNTQPPPALPAPSLHSAPLAAPLQVIGYAPSINKGRDTPIPSHNFLSSPSAFSSCDSYQNTPKAGYYCPGDNASPSVVATLTKCGSPTVYCPEGSVDPTPVRAGFYSVGGGSDGATRVSQVRP